MCFLEVSIYFLISVSQIGPNHKLEWTPQFKPYSV